MLRTIAKLAIVLVLVFILFPIPVYAYLDPGSGSYLIQIIIASVAGAGIIVKTQWENIKTIFNKKKIKADKDNEEK